jgi:hypothetical protein
MWTDSWKAEEEWVLKIPCFGLGRKYLEIGRESLKMIGGQATAELIPNLNSSISFIVTAGSLFHGSSNHFMKVSSYFVSSATSTDQFLYLHHD